MSRQPGNRSLAASQTGLTDATLPSRAYRRTSSMPKPKPSKSLEHQLPVPVEMIERRIYLIRGQKVMLDRDLAELYSVETKALNRAVGRNRERFPDDFMF